MEVEEEGLAVQLLTFIIATLVRFIEYVLAFHRKRVEMAELVGCPVETQYVIIRGIQALMDIMEMLDQLDQQGLPEIRLVSTMFFLEDQVETAAQEEMEDLRAIKE